MATTELTIEAPPQIKEVALLIQKLRIMNDDLIGTTFCTASRNRSRRGWLKRIKVLCQTHYPERWRKEMRDRYLYALHVNAEYFDVYDEFLRKVKEASVD